MAQWLPVIYYMSYAIRKKFSKMFQMFVMEVKFQIKVWKTRVTVSANWKLTYPELFFKHRTDAAKLKNYRYEL